MLRPRSLQHHYKEESRRLILKSTLDDVLNYQNEDVVARFAEDHGFPEADSQEIFHEMKRWLWLCAKRKAVVESGEGEFFAVPLFNEARAIDMMWHTFLLYTEDYARFCDHYFGFFLHHQPRSRAERKAWQEKIVADPATTRAERRQSLQQVYGYLYDELGPEILQKWCEEFPRRFQFGSPAK